MRRIMVVCLLILISAQLKAADKPSYKGLLRIPVGLLTPDGNLLENGQYELEARPVNDDYVLSFSLDGKIKANLKSSSDAESGLSSAHIPLAGTHYLRSSSEPVLTGEERRFSKTGAAQYEEEKRDWKASLRAYKSSAEGKVYFLFQVRGEQGHWNRRVFRVSLKENARFQAGNP